MSKCIRCAKASQWACHQEIERRSTSARPARRRGGASQQLVYFQQGTATTCIAVGVGTCARYSQNVAVAACECESPRTGAVHGVPAETDQVANVRLVSKGLAPRAYN